LQEKLKLLYQRTLNTLIDVQIQVARAKELKMQVADDEINGQVDTLKKQNQLSEEQFVALLKSRGLTLEAYRKQVHDGLLIAKVVNNEVRSRLVLQEAEVRAAYRERQERYKQAGEQTISHILFLVPQEASSQEEERIRTQAEAVLQQLQRGGDFATLARQYSSGPSAERGGLLGTFRAGELLPEFEAVVATLKPGEMSNVVRTPLGFHIIRVDARQQGGVRSFEEVQEEIRTELLRTRTEQKYQEWLGALRQQAYIKILYEG
jgi:peptidyl-prolyl cis-trans isomerase SurA